jgi:hypothetical protein
MIVYAPRDCNEALLTTFTQSITILPFTHSLTHLWLDFAYFLAHSSKAMGLERAGKHDSHRRLLIIALACWLSISTLQLSSYLPAYEILKSQAEIVII